MLGCGGTLVPPREPLFVKRAREAPVMSRGPVSFAGCVSALG